VTGPYSALFYTILPNLKYYFPANLPYFCNQCLKDREQFKLGLSWLRYNIMPRGVSLNGFWQYSLSV